MRMAPASAHRPGANGSRSVRTRPPTRCCAFEHDRFVAGAAELRRGDQPGHARADDRDARRAIHLRPEAVGEDPERIRSARGRCHLGAASGRSRTTSSSLPAASTVSFGGLIQAPAVDEHADEQRVVLVLEQLQRVPGALVHELRRQRDAVELLALGVGEQIGDHGGEAVGAGRRREQRAGELGADHELVGAGALEVDAVLRLDHLDAGVRVVVDGLDREGREQGAGVDVVGGVARRSTRRRGR